MGKFWKGSQGLYEGQKFDVTHQACRLIALDDISVIRPKKNHPVALKIRGEHNVPPPQGLIVDPIAHALLG